MFRSLSCSQSIPSRIRRRTVTLHFYLLWNCQMLVYRSPGIVQLDLLAPLRKTPPLQRSMLSSSDVWIQISRCDTNLSHQSRCVFFSRLDRQRKSLSTKTVILSTCFCLRNLSADLGFPTRYRTARFNGTKSSSRGSLILWAKCFAASARSLKVSYKQICILLRHFYSESDSVFRLEPVCLIVSLVVFVFHPDSLMTSGACLTSGSMSRYSPALNSEHKVQQQKAFHV